MVCSAMRVLRSILLFALLGSTQAREVVMLTWETNDASPPPALAPAATQWLPIFRVALGTLPESATVAMALSQPAILGLPASTQKTLLPLVARRYELIAADPAFSKAPSALPYCFSAQKPTTGYAMVYLPEHVSRQSEVIVFLHGYGGSFLWYLHYLAEVFPDRVIIAPAYGLAPAIIPPQYVAEALQAAERQLGYSLTKPKLFGLSNGGLGACSVFAANPQAYASLTVIAAYPIQETWTRLPRGRSLRFLAGEHDAFVIDGSWQITQRTLQTRGIAATFNLIPGADHFFLLTHPELSKKWLLEEK